MKHLQTIKPNQNVPHRCQCCLIQNQSFVHHLIDHQPIFFATPFAFIVGGALFFFSSLDIWGSFDA
jgi:hypothetical protein